MFYIEAYFGIFATDNYKIYLLAVCEDINKASELFDLFCNEPAYNHCRLELTSDGSVNTAFPVIAYRNEVQ